MKRFIFAAVATVTLVVWLSSQAMSRTGYAYAQSKSSPVTAFLDRLGMKYTEKDGNILVLAGVDGGRSQIGLIVSTTSNPSDVEYINVVSVSQISNTRPNAENTKQLQQSSFNDSLSERTTIFQNGMYITFYYKTISLKDEPDLARQEIIKILNIADTAEKDLTGKDEF